MYKSQNNETEIVLNYFQQKYGSDFRGNVLDIGANDGITFSNSYDLINMGWYGILVEPSSVFFDLQQLYAECFNAECHNVAIGKERALLPFWESGAHVPNGSDKALVSTFNENELSRWPDVEFIEKDMQVITFSDLMSRIGNSNNLHYISLDVEGHEMQILEQINLTEVGCQVLCIEHNGVTEIIHKFTDYCSKFGMKEIHRNNENSIYAR